MNKPDIRPGHLEWLRGAQGCALYMQIAQDGKSASIVRGHISHGGGCELLMTHDDVENLNDDEIADIYDTAWQDIIERREEDA